jgi:hypothetical protein
MFVWGFALGSVALPSAQLRVRLNGQIDLYTLVLESGLPRLTIRFYLCGVQVQREEKRAKDPAFPFLSSSCPGVNSARS